MGVLTGAGDAGHGYQEPLGGWDVLVFFCVRLVLGVLLIARADVDECAPQVFLTSLSTCSSISMAVSLGADMVKWFEVGVNKSNNVQHTVVLEICPSTSAPPDQSG